MRVDPLSEKGDASRLNGKQRLAHLLSASTSQADLLVIGGGVTGAGVALDAVSRGLKVVMVEAGDIANGTSSRSGKTFHGGLRYLEQLNFKLVAHAIAERDLMINTLCPHMAWPEPFVFPLRAHWERPYIGAGVTLYDLFGLRGRAVPVQKHFGRKALKAYMPSIDDKLVVGGIQYYDALMDDARHTLAVARTAASMGAHIITHAPVVGFLKSATGEVQGVEVKDSEGGQLYRLRAHAVVNATGIWADDMQQLAGANTFRVQAAKGVHLLLRPQAIQGNAGILARATDSVIIARRWYGYWLVGTTDSPWDKRAGPPTADAADIHYLLDNLNPYLSQKIGVDDVLGTFAGVRPLLKPVAGGDTTSALSRDHAVISGPKGLTTIVGGKYTTYRRMAIDAVDAAVNSAARALGEVKASRTHELPLLGAVHWRKTRDRVKELAERYQLSEDMVSRLMARHGDGISDVLALTHANPELLSPLAGATQYLCAELVHAACAEGAHSLADVMVRRTHLSIELRDGGVELSAHVATMLAPHLGWSQTEMDAQVHNYKALIAGEQAALNLACGRVTASEV